MYIWIGAYVARRVEVEELGDDRVRDPVVDRDAEVDDPIAEQMRVDVDDPLAPTRAVDDVGNRVLAHDRTPTLLSPNGRPVPIGAKRSDEESTMRSMRPYLRAASAENHRSRRESAKIRS